jgi:hypothetical protein
MTTYSDVKPQSSLCCKSKICSLENIMETNTLKTLNHSYGKEGDICALAKQIETKVPTTLPSKATCYKQLKDAKKIKTRTRIRQCSDKVAMQITSKKTMQLDGSIEQKVKLKVEL